MNEREILVRKGGKFSKVSSHEDTISCRRRFRSRRIIKFYIIENFLRKEGSKLLTLITDPWRCGILLCASFSFSRIVPPFVCRGKGLAKLKTFSSARRKARSRSHKPVTHLEPGIGENGREAGGTGSRWKPRIHFGDVHGSGFEREMGWVDETKGLELIRDTELNRGESDLMIFN